MMKGPSTSPNVAMLVGRVIIFAAIWIAMVMFWRIVLGHTNPHYTGAYDKAEFLAFENEIEEEYEQEVQLLGKEQAQKDFGGLLPVTTTTTASTTSTAPLPSLGDSQFITTAEQIGSESDWKQSLVWVMPPGQAEAKFAGRAVAAYEHGVEKLNIPPAHFLKFIVDFYDKLPKVSVFLSKIPDALSLHDIECLKEDAKYAPLGGHFATIAPVPYAAKGCAVEKCWRSIAAAASIDIGAEKTRPSIATYDTNGQFAASREQIKLRSKADYEKLLAFFDEQCTDPPGADYQPHSAYGCNKDYVPTQVSIRNDQQMPAWRAMHHMIFGHERANNPQYTKEQWCSLFKKNNEDRCRQSRCL